MLSPVLSGPHQHQLPCVPASTDVAERPWARVGILVSAVLDTERVQLGTVEEAEEAVVLVQPRTSHSAIHTAVARRHFRGRFSDMVASEKVLTRVYQCRQVAVEYRLGLVAGRSALADSP